MTTVLAFLLLCALATASGNWKLVNENDHTAHPDCQSLREAGYSVNGTYRLTLNQTKLLTRCVFVDAYSYMVMIRRTLFNVNFEQGFTQYKEGLGSVWWGDYFMGLDQIHRHTATGNKYLWIRMTDWSNKEVSVYHNSFFVDSMHANYKLRLGDCNQRWSSSLLLCENNYMNFHTLTNKDSTFCVNDMRGGWWYSYKNKDCTYFLPTGHHYPMANYRNASRSYLPDGIFYSKTNPFISLNKLTVYVGRQHATK